MADHEAVLILLAYVALAHLLAWAADALWWRYVARFLGATGNARDRSSPARPIAAGRARRDRDRRRASSGRRGAIVARRMAAGRRITR